MASNEMTPIFNLRAVTQETGLKPDTLRAWERRYGLPKPQRTSGGHRLYSRRDIAILKWLVARQEEGLSISNAVELWSQLAAEGQDPLTRPEYTEAQPAATPAIVAGGESLTELRDGWVSACMAFDERLAEQVLTQAFAQYPAETVCLDLLLEGVAQIGQRWYEGEVTVQQEHFASELAMRRLEALVAAAPVPTRNGRILAACPPHEDHTFGLLLLAFLLRRQGWDVLYLGANVPLQHMEATIVDGNPQLVLSVAQQLHTAATLLEMAHAVQALGIPVAFGGTIFNRVPALTSRIPGTYLGERLDAAPRVVEQVMVGAAPPPSAVEPPSEAYEQALAHFRDQVQDVNADVWRVLRDAGTITQPQLSQANEGMAQTISAALALGDISYVGNEIAWVEGILLNQQVPRELLHHYLGEYHRALQTHLDERGEPIVAWLGELL